MMSAGVVRVLVDQGRLQAIVPPKARVRGAMAGIRVGLVGCGFVSELHVYAYRRVYGVDVELAAVAARGDHVVDVAARHNILSSL